MCPGNRRANGERNPEYISTFAFTNDFPALVPGTPDETLDEGLLTAAGESGVCRVVCFSPRHDLTLAQMPVGEIRLVVDLWAAERAELVALRREARQLRMEREILKKAAAFFAKESQ
jgi:UDPglucose--hexose-1-phosphate uridylyltransferase